MPLGESAPSPFPTHEAITVTEESARLLWKAIEAAAGRRETPERSHGTSREDTSGEAAQCSGEEPVAAPPREVIVAPPGITRQLTDDDVPAALSVSLGRRGRQHACVIGASVVSWYSASMIVTAINKYLFDVLEFHHPLLVTFIHLTFTSIFLHVGFPYTGVPDRSISVRNYLRFILPIALLGSAEIALSNLAYTAVSLSVMTVIKSSAAVLTYLLSVLVGLEQLNYKLLAAVVAIVCSICLTVPGMEVRDSRGIVFLCVAVLATAVRWVIVHHQLQRHNYSTLQLLLLTQPLSALCLALPTFITELPHAAPAEYWGNFPVARIFVLVGVAIAFAFCVVFAEYRLVEHTSSASLTVAGVGKEILTILMSVALFGEVLTPRAAVGIACSILGILTYARLRLSASTKGPRYDDPRRALRQTATELVMEEQLRQ